MVKFFKLALIFSALIFLGVSQNTYAQDNDTEINTLKGLNGIAVAVGNIDTDASVDGLNGAKLIKDVTAKLKKSGIKVYTNVELPTIPGQPVLLINVDTVKQPGPIYIFTVSLDLSQIVVLQRNSGLTSVSPTWTVLTTGGAIPEDLMKNVQAALDPMLENFISDFKKANPK